MLKETETEALKVEFLAKRPTASIADFKLFMYGYEKGKLSMIIRMTEQSAHHKKEIRFINHNYVSQTTN